MTRNRETNHAAIEPSTSPSFGKRLKWVEPRVFRKPERKGSWKTVFGIISLTIGAAVAFLCIIYGFDFGAKETWNLLAAAGAIIILCLVVWVCSYLMQNEVEITDKAIVAWDLGDVPTVFRFGAIDHCEIGNRSVGGRTMSVLVVALKNGDRETFGIAPSVSIEALRRTLEQRGMSVGTRPYTREGEFPASEKDDLHSQIEQSAPDLFESIVDCLKKDGLTSQADRFDELLHRVAWTTGTEMIGELGLEMKRTWPIVKRRGTGETKEVFRTAARLVRKSWPLFRL